MFEKHIPDTLVLLVTQFVRPNNIYILRDICKTSRILLDKTHPIWESILEKHVKPKRILYNKSIGTTALLVAASKKTPFCVCCEREKPLVRNYYYGVVICTHCHKTRNCFAEVNLRKACIFYFLNYVTQKENENLVKIRNGRSFRVLLKDIVAIAHDKYPEGELQEKLDNRYKRNRETENRRHFSRESRKKNVNEGFSVLKLQNRKRIDNFLSEIEPLENIVNMYGCNKLIFGDINSFKVKTTTNVDTVCQRLFEYAMMITYMKKKGLLDQEYNMKFLNGTTPKYIFLKHIRGGLHFYETVVQYAESTDELEKRNIDVERFLLTETSKQQRKSLAIALCVEDSVDYSSEDFNDFVEFGLGNPVYIARNKRCTVFLNQNSFMAYLNYFLDNGYHMSDAWTRATNKVLERTLGYPPMKRCCYINLRTI